MTNPKVLLIGPGGVGAIVAYGLFYTGKCDLSVVIRRDYDRVVKEGYEIDSVDYGHVEHWRPNHIYPSVDDAAKGGPYDYVVITTKNLPDVLKLEDLTEPVITKGVTTVVLIQNGFDIGRPFIEKYPENYCLSGVSHIGSHNNNGVITHSQTEKLLVSYFDNPNFSKESQEKKAKEFVEIYDNDRHETTYFPDQKWYRYRKLVYNATLNTTCAVTGLDTGRLTLSGAMDTVAVPAMREVIEVAKADGVDLPSDMVNTVVHSDDWGYFAPSMLVDVRKGNPIELEVILGNLLRTSKQLKVETPKLQMLYDLLKAVQFRLREAKGQITVPEKWTGSGKKYDDDDDDSKSPARSS